MELNEIKNYTIEKKQYINELKTDAYILSHNKTGARVALLSNNDDNKVFYIGFRTPPSESTGVMHILEHSVLCGSKNFPVKDPFIELAKGSLNTFLNAMTYPDKTVYPVASCNDKDFQNLMHIYLDAVFFPNILNSDKTFRQEGWHYELNSAEDDLTINGVVYNEMKGAFSSPDDVLEREIFNSLFPDTEYSEESGGDPRVIPKLTYEHYIEVYKQYYHPSNSYIYLYGDMDMKEKLEFIDKEYLSKFDKCEIDSEIRTQKPFDSLHEVKMDYSVTKDEPLAENTYLSYNVATVSNLDREQYIAMQVIDYALGNSQGAVLKKALLDGKIGKDIYSFYDNGVRQPYFSIVAKNSEEDKKEEFVETIMNTLKSVVRDGFDKDTLKAGLNSLEFKYREADFGSYPPGLMYGLQILDSWLYEDSAPFIHIAADDTFKLLRAAIETDYYERLVQKWIIDNKHASLVVVTPKVGLVEEEDKRLAEELAKYKASLSKEEIEKIVADSAELIAYQEAEDDPEALAKIPILSISDIKKEALPFSYKIGKIENCECITHDIYTNGIDYVRFIFDASNVPEKLFPYVGILKSVWGMVDTDKYTYGELFNQIFMNTGGIAPVINVYNDTRTYSDSRVSFEVKCKCFEGDLKNVFDIVTEIITSSKFDDMKRMEEIFDEIKSHTQSSMIASGHMVALRRAISYLTVNGKLNDILTGYDQYKLVESISDNFNEKKDELIENIKEAIKYVFTSKNLTFDFTGAESEYKKFEELSKEFIEALGDGKTSDVKFAPKPKKLNEGFTSASQVQFVCQAGNFREAGLEYTGALKVLRVIFGYDYLWNNIRVKGGAYGCMSSFGRSGESYMVSYRDPNLASTLDVYKKVADYIADFDVDERAMSQYIIGTISDMDTPLTPSAKASRDTVAYLSHFDADTVQKERDEVLGCSAEDIRALLPYIEAVLSQNVICAVGNAQRIKEEEKFFDHLVTLYN